MASWEPCVKPADRQKMCRNCDGRIGFDATKCPYCFATQPNPSDAENMSPSPLYAPQKHASPHQEQAAAASEFPPAEGKSFWPLLMLVVGGNLLTLGVLQLLFADHGVLRLEMHTNYWFLMLLIACPLVYIGFKKTS